MGLFLAADDINVGDWVTIHSQNRPHRRSLRRILEGGTSVWPVGRGIPIQIVAVNLPFLMCEGFSQGKTSKQPVLIEIDRFRLCRVSNEYAEEFSRLKHLCAQNDDSDTDSDN